MEPRRGAKLFSLAPLLRAKALTFQFPLGGHFCRVGGSPANLFSHAEQQKPEDKLARWHHKHAFSILDSANIRSKRTPEAYAHHIRPGFSPGGSKVALR